MSLLGQNMQHKERKAELCSTNLTRAETRRAFFSVGTLDALHLVQVIFIQASVQVSFVLETITRAKVSKIQSNFHITDPQITYLSLLRTYSIFRPSMYFPWNSVSKQRIFLKVYNGLFLEVPLKSVIWKFDRINLFYELIPNPRLETFKGWINILL